jgi:hypothetical protein
MVDDLDTGVLFVIEASVVKVAVDKDIDSLSLEILGIIQNKILFRRSGA